jgi:hypothetical protein
VAHGLGVFRADTPTGRWWFHSGDAVGYWATALVREGDGVAVSWAANGNYGSLDAPVSSRAAFDEVLALVDPAGRPPMMTNAHEPAVAPRARFSPRAA